jgi:hypothetical protein
MATGALRTNDTSNKELKEDLLDLITNLSPTMTPIFTGLQKSKAENSVHQWLNDTIARQTTTTAQAEGQDVTFGDLGSPSRGANYVQEITAPFKISQKMRDAGTAGYSDPVAYYGAKAMKTWKLKAEYALIHGTGNSGASGVAWEMTGLRKAITTNYYSSASGTSLTEKLFNDVLELAYGDVEDDTFEFYGSMFHKRQISAFTSGSTKNIDAKDRRLVNAVDIYQSDVASNVKLFAHRDIAAAQKFFMVIQPKAFAVAFMHNPEVMDSAASGPYTAKYVYGSLTLEYRQETAGVRGENFLSA